MALYHFSEDPAIDRFTPHVPRTNPDHPPAVWAIDADHAPLYWFPRDCPRVTAWPKPGDKQYFDDGCATTAPRLHAIEWAWLATMTTTTIYRYRFDPARFRPWPEANGQWISDEAVEPVAVDRIDHLLGAHDAAGIELRVVASLWDLHDRVQSDRWDFSIVRMSNAEPRS